MGSLLAVAALGVVCLLALVATSGGAVGGPRRKPPAPRLPPRGERPEGLRRG